MLLLRLSLVAAAGVPHPVPTCRMFHDTDFWCYWPKTNPNHTGTFCDEIAQVPSESPENCCNLCIQNSSASPTAHAGTLNCTGFAYNFGAKLCFMKAKAIMNETGRPVNSTDTSGRLTFKSDDEVRHESADMDVD
eukprot:SAG31_NODE_16049_length_725_cov_1.416933_1_plen_134_part_10